MDASSYFICLYVLYIIKNYLCSRCPSTSYWIWFKKEIVHYICGWNMLDTSLKVSLYMVQSYLSSIYNKLPNTSNCGIRFLLFGVLVVAIKAAWVAKQGRPNNKAASTINMRSRNIFCYFGLTANSYSLNIWMLMI